MPPASVPAAVRRPGSRADLAKTGVGVVVKAGAPLPDIGSVDAFKRALLAAKSVAYIDPAAGGSSGIYVGKLLERLGIADEVNAKAKLIQGGEVADHIVDGEAEIGIHQISEILAVKGAVLVGPLPAEIQNFTVYSAGVGTAAKDGAAASALVKFLAGPHAGPIIKAKGMEPGVVTVPKSQRPHEAGAGLGHKSGSLGFRMLPGEPRDVRTGDADIGQFAVVEARKFPHRSAIALPGVEEVDYRQKHFGILSSFVVESQLDIGGVCCAAKWNWCSAAK